MLFAHFKIETVNSILTKVTTNFYMAKRVIKDFKVFKIFIWWKTFISLLACLMACVPDQESFTSNVN